MRLWGYQLTEHDPAKPWLVLGSQHRTIELPEERSFFEWANEEWQRDRLHRHAGPRRAIAEGLLSAQTAAPS